MDKRRKKKKPAKTNAPKKRIKLINIAPWVPFLAILGFIIGFSICYITFVYYGGN